jgi:DNA-binding protein YbaB
MANASRTLTLKLLADIDNFQKNLKNADNNVSGFEAGIQKFSKVAGAAFLAAGAAAAAYAGKIAIDGVKAAIEDEAAQLKLAKSLENVTGATDAQIKATEDYILKTSLAYGVTDEQLRPSLDRLVRSTKSVEEAQKLQTLALNIAAGTGKDLTAVSEALARAHDGNFGSLKKLGVSIDESIIKQKDFDAATKVLAETFQNQASAQADTFSGKMNRLKVAFDEGKETIGGFILDAITPMVNGIVEKVIPAVTAFIDGIGGTKGLKAAFDQYAEAAKAIFIPIFEGIKFAFDQVKNAIMNNKEEFQALFNFLKDFVAPLLGGALKLAIQGIGIALSAVINTIGFFIDKITAAYDAVKKLIDFVKNNPVTKFLTGASFGTSNASFMQTDYSSSSVGGGGGYGIMTPEQQARFEELKAQKEILKQQTADIKARIAARARGEIVGSGNNVNITVNGAIDPEATSRQIVNLLNNSFYRGTGGADGLVY